MMHKLFLGVSCVVLCGILLGCNKSEDDFFASQSSSSTSIHSGPDGTSFAGYGTVKSRSKGNYNVSVEVKPNGENYGLGIYEDGRVIRHTYNEEAEIKEQGYEYLNEWSPENTDGT